MRNSARFDSKIGSGSPCRRGSGPRSPPFAAREPSDPAVEDGRHGRRLPPSGAERRLGSHGNSPMCGHAPRSRDRARPAVGTHAGRASRGGTSGGVVPFRWTPGQIEVEVSVNGTALEWFIVDSGAEYSILDDQLAHASTSARPHGSDGRSRHGVSLRGPNQWKHHDNRSPHSAVGWIGPALSRSVLRDGDAVWVRYR